MFSFNVIECLFVFFICLFVAVFILFQWKFSYWKRRNLQFLPPTFPFGNVLNPLTIKEKPGIFLEKLYKEFRKRNWKHGGLYFFVSPVYLVADLDLVQNILTKDFRYFCNSGIFHNEKDDPLSANLLTLGGQKWKNLRSKTNLFFTSNKIKLMFSLVEGCGQLLLKKLELKAATCQEINIKEEILSFTANVIASCVFGLESDLKDECIYYGQKSVSLTKTKIATQMLASMFPKLAKTLRVKVIPKDVSDFFTKMVKKSIMSRDQEYFRQDFMQLMLDLKNQDNSYTIEKIAAQCLLFFVAGFDTSASTLVFTLYELSKNEEIQNKARTEIENVLAKFDDSFCYEALSELKYLQQVLDETLRKYPALLYITRKCSKNYKVPNQNVTIEEGTTVLVPVLGIHNDNEYYPEPNNFDPGRFSDENKASRHKYSFLPFGGGPRTCIGKRFGLMQIKVALVFLLKNFKFTISDKTENPLCFKIDCFITTPKNDVWLNVEKI